jgi:hypothetical protein
MVKTNDPIPYDSPLRKDPRGRKPRKVLSPEEVKKLVSVMNPLTFVAITKEDKVKIGKLRIPDRNEKYEEIFYRSLKENEITTIAKWINCIYDISVKLSDESKTPFILAELGIPPYGEKVLNMLADCEVQRWYEMYYVKMILKNGRCSTNYPGYNAVTANAIAAKYGLVDIPCAMDNIVPPERVEPTRKRGRPSGGKKIDFQKIEDLRTSLMKCKAPTAISKEFDVTDQTIYDIMHKNEFLIERDQTKTLPIHTAAILRLIPNGDTTWEYYVRMRALCEKALAKSVHADDPTFFMKYNVAPTKPSLTFEYNKFSGSVLKLAQAFGVSQDVVRMWLDKYEMGRISPRGIVPREPGKARGGVMDDETYRRLGIDPDYDPGKSDRVKFDPSVYK